MKPIHLIFGVCSGCLIVSVVIAVFCYGTVRNVIHDVNRIKPPHFCTLDDEVYQAIVSDHMSWVETFRSRSETTQLGSRTLVFSVASGKEYAVDARFWNIWNVDSSPMLLISVEGWSWQGVLGSAGYIYSPTGRLIQSSREYEFNHFDEDIYCYHLK